MKREELLFLAKLSQQAERYDEMREYMKNLFTLLSEFTVEERNLLSVAYKNAIGSRRASWRVISSIENKESDKGNTSNVELIKEYKKKIEEELSNICLEIINLLDKKIISNASTDESKVFFFTMQGDYYKYLCEIKKGDEYREMADKALNAYNTASDIANKDLAPTDPIRLGLALNFSVFQYEILKQPNEAAKRAKQAFDDAIADLIDLREESYKDSTLIMQLLRDNLTLWTSSDTDDYTEQDDIDA